MIGRENPMAVTTKLPQEILYIFFPYGYEI